MFKIICLVLVIGFIMVLGSSDLWAQSGKPPLSAKRIAGKIAAGWVGGFCVAYAGLGLGELLGYDARPISDQKFEGEAEWGAVLCWGARKSVLLWVFISLETLVMKPGPSKQLWLVALLDSEWQDWDSPPWVRAISLFYS